MAEVSRRHFTRDDRVREELTKASLTTPDSILQLSDFGLLRLGSLTEADISNLTSDAAASLLKPGFMTALEACTKLDKSWIKLSTGCNHLDKVLGGGLPVRGITEIAGDGGSGKTQLCLQLSLSVQYPTSQHGLGAGAVYICTEDTFPSCRLQQLFQTYPTQRSQNCNKEYKLPKFGDNVFVEHIADVEGLRQCVLGRLPQLLSQRKIGLVVIDSIAGAFRTSYEPKEMSSRAQDLRMIGGQLHLLARRFNLCVICVNQVSAAVDEKPQAVFQHHTVPALGLAWANLVTARIQLHRLEYGGADGSHIRSLEIVFAPNLPQQCCHFSVTKAGVFGLI